MLPVIDLSEGSQGMCRSPTHQNEIVSANRHNYVFSPFEYLSSLKGLKLGLHNSSLVNGK
jgi:hypothetical protein